MVKSHEALPEETMCGLMSLWLSRGSKFEDTRELCCAFSECVTSGAITRDWFTPVIIDLQSQQTQLYNEVKEWTARNADILAALPTDPHGTVAQGHGWRLPEVCDLDLNEPCDEPPDLLSARMEVAEYSRTIKKLNGAIHDLIRDRDRPWREGHSTGRGILLHRVGQAGFSAEAEDAGGSWLL